MKLQKIVLIACLIMSINISHAQTFGVRAGLNYSKFNGPSVPGEQNTFSNGFHFGLNYAYDITDLFSIRAELLYIQNGSKYQYIGDSYYVIRQPNKVTFEKGDMEYNLNISNAYISIPIVANYKLSRKWEVFGGAYFNLLVGPTGRGNLRFESSSRPEDIVFRQSLDFRYGNDNSAEITGNYLGGIQDIGIYVDGEDVTLPKFAGAYTQLGDKPGTFINKIDYGLTAGVHYFLNRGFYIGLRFDYGFPDLTNNNVDVSIVEFNPDNTFRFSDDKDSHLGFQVSFGFRF